MGAAGALPGMHASLVPISLLSDSYKASHYLQYPDCKQMVAVCTPPCHPHAVMPPEQPYPCLIILKTVLHYVVHPRVLNRPYAPPA